MAKVIGLCILVIGCACMLGMGQVALAAEDAATTPAAAADNQLDVPVFPLDQLKAGLKGTGYTVIRGTEIKPFNAEILELIPKGGFDGGPMILARFSGETIDFSNGIAGGYSGSPVYIDGKLVGAVSMAIPYTDTHIGGITPIQSMLKALPDVKEYDFSGNTVLPTSTDSGKPLDEEGAEIENHKETAPPAESQAPQVTYTDDYAKALAYNDAMQRQGLHRYAAVRCATPIYFSGISPDVLNTFGSQLEKKLGANFKLMDRPMGKAGDYGLFLGQDQPAQGPGLLLQQKTATPPALVGGDAVAVSLMQGDIEAYAVGTLTYSDQKGRFLCFGHPMMASGDTNFPVGKAYVVWTFKSIERAFKEGVRLNSAGTMTKDKAAACGGILGQEPDMIPIRVKIKDVDLGTTVSKKFSVIRHPDYTPMLMAMGLSQVATEILDRQPNGTMKMSYHIEGVGLREPLRRTNYYSDGDNVLMSSAMDLVPISNLLETNIYRDVKVTKVELLVEITRNRINASIDDAEIMNKDLHPGMQQNMGMPGAVPMEAVPSAAPAAPPQDAPEDPNEGMSGGEMWLRYRLQQQPAPSPDETMPGQAVPVAATQNMVPPPANIPTFMPGDVIRVKVRFQPYRTDAVWREFSVKVPEDFPAGNTMVVVHGGGDLISPSELNGKGRNLFSMGPIIDLQSHDLDSVLEQIVAWPLNNELLVTLVRPYDPAAAQELGASQSAGAADGSDKPEDKVDATYQMEWVIYNGFMLPVNIVTEPMATPPPAQGAPAAEAAAGATAGEAAKPAGEGNGEEEMRAPKPETDLPF